MKLKKIEIDLSAEYGASICFIEFEYKIGVIKNKIKINEEVENAKIGEKIEIKGGYEEYNYSYSVLIFIGYIFSVEISMENSETQRLIIHAMDAKMFLMANKKTELKKNKKNYSDIVKNTLNNYLSKASIGAVNISGESELNQSICQRRESDYDFLCRLADLNGCLFYVSKGEFFFVNIGYKKSINLVLKPNICIKNINFKANILGIPKKLSINRVDEKEYNVLEHTEALNMESIGSGKVATEHTNNISSNNSVIILDNTLPSVEAARRIANAKLSKRNLKFVNCTLETIFIPELELGTGIKITDFGAPFDNEYVIISIKHYSDILGSKTVMVLFASCYKLTNNFF